MHKERTSIAIRFNDIDVAGHVHNAMYLHYFEQGRMQFLEHFIPKDHNWSDQGLILARNEIDYKEPVFLHDKIEVHTWCSRIGRSSFDLSYEVVREGSNDVCASGMSVLVCYRYKDRTTIPVPQTWKAKLTELNPQR